MEVRAWTRFWPWRHQNYDYSLIKQNTETSQTPQQSSLTHIPRNPNKMKKINNVHKKVQTLTYQTRKEMILRFQKLIEWLSDWLKDGKWNKGSQSKRKNSISRVVRVLNLEKKLDRFPFWFLHGTYACCFLFLGFYCLDQSKFSCILHSLQTVSFMFLVDPPK